MAAPLIGTRPSVVREAALAAGSHRAAAAMVLAATEAHAGAMIRQPDVEHFLAHYAVALSDGELPAIGRHWMLPGFVATDQESFALNNADDIEIVFGEVVAINRKRDVAAARSEVLKLEPLGARLVSVDVRWQYLDAGGANVGS